MNALDATGERAIIVRHRFEFGKIAFTSSRLTNAVTVDLELRETASGPQLSISGSIWNHMRTDIVSGGQNLDTIKNTVVGRTVAFKPIYALWKRWHLNGMNAGCEHQRATWQLDTPLEVVSWGLTNAASQLRTKAMERAARSVAAYEVAELSETERALILLTDWFKDRNALPEAGHPLTGCYEERKRETRRRGSVTQAEHPGGLLGKPCEVCGYGYGTAWVHEALPADVIAEIMALTKPRVCP